MEMAFKQRKLNCEKLSELCQNKTIKPKKKIKQKQLSSVFLLESKDKSFQIFFAFFLSLKSDCLSFTNIWIIFQIPNTKKIVIWLFFFTLM